MMNLDELKKLIEREKQIVKELRSLFVDLEDIRDSDEKRMVLSQIEALKKSLKLSNAKAQKLLNDLAVMKKLPSVKAMPLPVKPVQPKTSLNKIIAKVSEDKPEVISSLERSTLERLKSVERKKLKFQREIKPNSYAHLANRFFSEKSLTLVKQKKFQTLDRALIKSNLQISTSTYLSILFFTTVLSICFAVLLFAFLLFFNIQATPPFLTFVTETLIVRAAKIFWVIFVIPIGTFSLVYLYPFAEKTTLAHRINQELPFATIHMAAISGSMIDPTKMFDIIIATKEYPALQKEFTKLLNEINVYGSNLVNALRNIAFNTSSQKLAELFNGLATTITSGGDLADFFEKRSSTLLFEHRIEREKEAKSAETFMDIYVSVVIAAPMILMLLLMMIKISGIGLSLSMSTISLLFVVGVSVINVVFLAFLHLKQSAG